MQFIIAALLSLALLVFTISVRAYEPDQLTECILSVQENTAVEDVSESAIENYCDCALDLIVDQKRDFRQSGYECANKSFD